MWTKINSIIDLNGYFLIEDKIYSYATLNKSLSEFDLNGVLLWEFEEPGVNFRYYVNSNYIVYNKKDKETGTTFLERAEKRMVKKNQLI